MLFHSQSEWENEVERHGSWSISSSVWLIDWLIAIDSSLVLETPCQFASGDTCGFYDASSMSTRWTVVAERTSVVRSGKSSTV